MWQGQETTTLKIELAKLSAKTLYSVSTIRWRYGRNPETLERSAEQHWFISPLFSTFSKARPTWRDGGYSYPAEVKSIAEACFGFMGEFCAMSDLDVEMLLVSRSTLDAARYSIKVKGERLHPDVEAILMERCKGKKSRMNALLMYCGKWDIMPDNMTEITMVAGFEGGRRGRIGADFIKKLGENKRKCRDLLSQIMKLEGIGEEEPISKIMERLK